MKKALVFVLALIMVLAALPVVGASADEVEKEAERANYPAAEMVEREYPAEMIEKAKVEFTTRDVTDAEIAWVKQATGALIWAPADDARSDDEIIARAKEADPSLTNGTSSFAVIRGYASAMTPNTNGSQADVSVEEKDGRIIMAITGDFSHFDFIAKEAAQTEEPVEAEKATLRIDTPLKMAVAFEDGTVYYGGEMKEVIVGKEYAFQMCSVNWENGVYDENGNGIAGTVVYRMIAVHRGEFKAIADKAKGEPERFTVKGIDVIDNKDKKIFVDIDAKDTHLETDVNNFFMAYTFHFQGQDYNKKTGIAQVINTPVESLSVNLPLGSTITCKAYNGEEQVDTADVFIVNNSGKGVYDDVELTSVNDFTWGEKLVAEEASAETYAEEVAYAEEHIEYAK